MAKFVKGGPNPRRGKQPEPPSPLQLQAAEWIEDDEPRIRMLGFMADGHDDNASVLMAGGTRQDFHDWLADDQWAIRYDDAVMRREAYYSEINRRLAIGVDTRRGQTYAIKNALLAFGGGSARKARKQASLDAPDDDWLSREPSIDEMTDEEAEAAYKAGV